MTFDLRNYLDTYARVVQALDDDSIERLGQAIADRWRDRRTVFLCGNGGSAANASHLAADLMKLTAPADGPRLRAVALGEGLPALTAAANDFSYADAFVEQLKSFLEPGDLVIGLSTSGSSPNVIRAIDFATSMGAVTAGITGASGSILEARSDHSVVIPSRSVQHIEDATMVVGHVLCLLVHDIIARTQAVASSALRTA